MSCRTFEGQETMNTNVKNSSAEPTISLNPDVYRRLHTLKYMYCSSGIEIAFNVLFWPKTVLQFLCVSYRFYCDKRFRQREDSKNIFM